MIETSGGFYPGMLTGTVVDNADPLHLHRVRILVPGIVEPATDWAWPITAGGGGPQRGGHIVPAIGADVCLWFEHGDPNGKAVYACGWWGQTGAGSEVPRDVASAGADAHKVQSFEIDGLSFTVDERSGARSLRVVARELADGGAPVEIASLEIDREGRGIVISATTAIVLRTPGLIHLEGLVVNINDRVVANSPGAI